MSVDIQSVMDLARLDINDAAKVRLTDADAIRYANDGIARVYAMRPDLQFGNYAAAYTDLSATDPFPFSIEYRPAVANYIVMRSESSDDQFAIEQRAINSMKLFMADLGVS